MNTFTAAPDYTAPDRPTKRVVNQQLEMSKLDAATVQLAALTAAFNALVGELNTARAAKTSKTAKTDKGDDA